MLRDYQQQLYEDARQALLRNKSACIQLATGGGKTAIISSVCRSVLTKEKRAWIITPRKELLDQSSKHLMKWNTPHGIIAPGNIESRAFNIHVVSKNTLERRWDKIKNWPDLICIDEIHINYDFQVELRNRAPEHTKFLGWSATPEKLDGRGLWTGAGGIYDVLVEGPSIPWLTERDFLTPLRYFSPPIEGINELRKRGLDIDQESLEDLLKRRKIYGECVGHYEKYGKGKAALIFCPSVKSSYETAERFRDKGHNFHCVEGKMSARKRKDLIDALTAGTIDGITSRDLCIYGIDIPRAEYGASLRYTFSFSVFMQYIGRILRPFTDEITGYKKEEAIFFDHVNSIKEHGIKVVNNGIEEIVPPHWAPHIKWNFKGTEKRKRNKNENNLRQCPNNDFEWCIKPSCAGCEHNTENKKDVRPAIIIPADLIEIAKPVKLNDRPMEERREYQDRINKAVQDAQDGEIDAAVKDMIEMAKEFGYGIMWVYWRLTAKDAKAVNVPLLFAIERQKGYKKGWSHFKKIEIRKQLDKKQEEIDAMAGVR